MTLLPTIPPTTVLIILGAVVVVSSLPLLFCLVKPNRLYGIRVPAAFASELFWYAINSFGAKRLHNHIRNSLNLPLGLNG